MNIKSILSNFITAVALATPLLLIGAAVAVGVYAVYSARADMNRLKNLQTQFDAEIVFVRGSNHTKKWTNDYQISDNMILTFTDHEGNKVIVTPPYYIQDKRKK